MQNVSFFAAAALPGIVKDLTIQIDASTLHQGKLIPASDALLRIFGAVNKASLILNTGTYSVT